MSCYNRINDEQKADGVDISDLKLVDYLSGGKVDLTYGS
jgi:hypothetical protein